MITWCLTTLGQAWSETFWAQICSKIEAWSSDCCIVRTQMGPWVPMTSLLSMMYKRQKSLVLASQTKLIPHCTGDCWNSGFCESKRGHKKMYIHPHGSLTSWNACPAGLLGSGINQGQRNLKLSLFMFFKLGSTFLFFPYFTTHHDKQLLYYLWLPTEILFMRL